MVAEAYCRAKPLPERDPLPATEIIRRLRAVILLLVASAAAAGVYGFAAWHLLPYAALGRETPAEEFLLWEAVMWMSGIAFVLFGGAAWFGSTDLYGRHADLYLDRSAEHVRRRMREGIQGRHLFSDLPAAPWLMTAVGAMLMLQAAVLRAALFG